MLRAQAGSRRREPLNPERYRAGKRGVENIYERREGRYVQESAANCSATQRLFCTPSRGDPNHEIRDHLLITKNENTLQL